MANKLCTERGASQVGQKWPSNFVRRTPNLTTRFNRPYDRQRALCEDPAVIKPWFNLVQRTKQAYSIPNKDTYNFNKTGFIIGKILSQLIIIGLERRREPKAIQPGNYKWVTVIQAINAAGQAVPPLIIFAGKYYLSIWYQEGNIPSDQAIAISDNGWTINKIGVAWLKHFIQYTNAQLVGPRRLLILNGYKSHNLLNFQLICKENNIITLCMPAYLLYLLQPLNIGCFSPLKRAYRQQINGLVRDYINYITKLKFLPVFKAAFNSAITKDNIYASF